MGSPVGSVYGSENAGFQVVDLLVWELGMGGRAGVLEVGGHKEGKVWVRSPAPGCPGAGSHRPDVPEGHAHEAIWQRQVGRPGLLGVDRSARTQRRAQGTPRLSDLLGDPWLQADPEEQAAGAPGAAGRPRDPRARSRPERVDLQLEDAGQPYLGRKGHGVRGPRGSRCLTPLEAPPLHPHPDRWVALPSSLSTPL